MCEPTLCVELLTVRPCGEKDGKGIVKSSLFPRGLRSWQTQSPGMQLCRRRRCLLPFVRREHHGQGPQPLLPRRAKEALPTGAGQALRSLHSLWALPVTLCGQLYADAIQQIPGRQAGLPFALRTPRRLGNCPVALPSPGAIIVLINDNKFCRSCSSPENATESPALIFHPSLGQFHLLAPFQCRFIRSGVDQPLGRDAPRVPHPARMPEPSPRAVVVILGKCPEKSRSNAPFPAATAGSR